MLATFLFIAFFAVRGNTVVFTLLYITFPNHMYKNPSAHVILHVKVKVKVSCLSCS